MQSSTNIGKPEGRNKQAPETLQKKRIRIDSLTAFPPHLESGIVVAFQASNWTFNLQHVQHVSDMPCRLHKF